MGEIISNFLSNASTYLVYAAIVILFVVACIKCLAPVTGNTRALNRAIKAMKKDKGKTVHRKTWENEEFLGDGALQPSWRLYLENVFFADSHMQAPCSVEDYINEDSVINVPGRSSLSETVPSVFVSLGFLGTLIGIVMSLSTMKFSTFDEVSASMLGMLSGMRYAFGTSIVGVIASVAFTVLNKTVQGRARNTLEEFTQIFQQDTDMPPVDPITQIATYQQEQTRALATLGNECQFRTAHQVDGELHERRDVQTGRGRGAHSQQLRQPHGSGFARPVPEPRARHGRYLPRTAGRQRFHAERAQGLYRGVGRHNVRAARISGDCGKVRYLPCQPERRPEVAGRAQRTDCRAGRSHAEGR